MSHNNAADVNVECEKATTMSLLDLNDLALLQVFSYLNLRDSIHFAETSKRLNSVGALHFTKYKRLDLLKYEWSEQPEKLPAKTILFHIGQHIKTLSINSVRSSVTKAVVDKCVNVTNLKIYNWDNNRKLKMWMQQLQLESLTIEGCIGFSETSVRLEALKELHFFGLNAGLTSMQLTNILQKTTELEALTVNLFVPYFNFHIFTRLPKLQCLDIWIKIEDLANLTKFLKMDGLTRFKLSLPYNSDAETLQRINSFLEILAEKSQLNELQLWARHVDQNTFRILKSFRDVTSLVFYVPHYVDHEGDDGWMVHQLVEARPNLKHLDFLDSLLLIEHVDIVVKNFSKLESFTFCMDTEDLEQLNESRINEMLKTSTSRPMLTLRINSDYGVDAIKIELRFAQRQHRTVQLDEAADSYFLTDRFTR